MRGASPPNSQLYTGTLGMNRLLAVDDGSLLRNATHAQRTACKSITDDVLQKMCPQRAADHARMRSCTQTQVSGVEGECQPAGSGAADAP